MPKRWIQVSENVFAELQRQAEPLVDDADSVLRRLLGYQSEEENSSPAKVVEPSRDATGLPIQEPQPAQERPRIRRTKSKTKGRGSSDRAPKGSLLPEADYALPLLETLVELDGSAPMSKVVEGLETKLEGKLTETDWKVLRSGKVRWRNRVQFVRLGLIKEGHMAKDSPRGVWEITDEGRAHVQTARRTS